jgi:hypothetical protein
MEARILSREGKKDVLQIDHAEILPGSWRNFSGRPGKYNVAGQRSFTVKIEPEFVDVLADYGFNIKMRPARDPQDEPLYYLKVKVNFREGYNGRRTGPTIHLETGNSNVILEEDDLYLLDDAYIVDASMDINPYNWGDKSTGEYGITAYLSTMLVVQEVDRFSDYLPCDASPEDEVF